ncbi:restriction endonuclease subunit S [Streptomyces griseoaurantiacus]|uniref:restriction endonuclease subunit S n=1 Tax=Streptomyces griseoaurantiacus TaxID=68213 RepID=UPI002ED4F9BB|nr:restriction endonuclease subunit S [Streptomyces jietaisiensis]
MTAFRDGEVTLRSNRRTEGFTNAIHEIGYQGIREGDLVVHGMDGFAGAIGVSDSDGKASPVVHTYVPNDDVDARYMAYALRTMALSGYVTTLAKGIRERSTSFDAPTLANVHLPTPPLAEQRRIADFLDTETTRIDALKHARNTQVHALTERLEAERDSLFGDTRDNAPVPLMHLTDPYRPIVYGIVQAGPEFPDGIPYIKTGDLKKLHPSSLSRTSPEIHEQFRRAAVHPGDIVMAMRASIGAVAIVPPELPEANLTQGTARIAATDGVSNEWLFHALQARRVREQCDLRAVGSTFRTLNIWDLRRIIVRRPSFADQKEIVAQFKQIEARHASLTDKAERQIALLTERRQALITAAVTGQFDVSTASGRNVTEGVGV